MVAGHAQKQEQKLIDRLLKPDMSLQNNAQGKEYDPSGAIATKEATTKWFFFRRRPREREYTNVQTIPARKFLTQNSALGQQQANFPSRAHLPKLEGSYATSAYATRKAVDGEKLVAVSNYSGTRPFLVRGKSQKALSAQDRQMTIDEVRELLNKNK